MFVNNNGHNSFLANTVQEKMHSMPTASCGDLETCVAGNRNEACPTESPV